MMPTGLEAVHDYWILESIKDQPFEDFYTLGDELGK